MATETKKDDDTGRKDADDATDDDDDDDDQDGDADDDDDDFDKERALRTIKAQRESEKALRKQLTEMKAQLGKFEAAGKSDDELTRKQRDDLIEKNANLETRYRKKSLKASAQYEAGKLGFHSPDIAYRMIDSDDVEWDDDNEPSNVKQLLREVLKEYPNLKRTRGADGGDDDDDFGKGRNGGRGKDDDMNSAIRLMMGRG